MPLEAIGGSGGGSGGSGLSTAQAARLADVPISFEELGLTKATANTGSTVSVATANANATLLQAAIDAATAAGGGTLYCDGPYAVGPITLKGNVWIVGNANPGKGGEVKSGLPGCSALIDARSKSDTGYDSVSAIEVTGHGWRLEGLVLLKLRQLYTTTTPSVGPNDVAQFAVTIKQKAGAFTGSGVLKDLCFVGDYRCVNIGASPSPGSQDFIIEGCYGYPIFGSFIKLDGVYDIPRIRDCHVNPTAGAQFSNAIAAVTGGHVVTSQIVDYVHTYGEPAFEMSAVDEFDLSGCFVYGGKTGYRSVNSYGAFRQCTADEVEVAFEITEPTYASRSVLIEGGTVIPSAGTSGTGNRCVVKADLAGSMLNVIGVTAKTGTGTFAPSSSTPDADAFLKYSGSGAGRVNLIGCRAIGYQGAFAVAVRDTGTHPLRRIEEVGCDWQATAKRAGNAFGQNVAFTSPYIDKNLETTNPVATRLVPVEIEGVRYNLLAALGPAFLAHFSMLGPSGVAATTDPEVGGPTTGAGRVARKGDGSAKPSTDGPVIFAPTGVLYCSVEFDYRFLTGTIPASNVEFTAQIGRSTADTDGYTARVVCQSDDNRVLYVYKGASMLYAAALGTNGTLDAWYRLQMQILPNGGNATFRVRVYNYATSTWSSYLANDTGTPLSSGLAALLVGGSATHDRLNIRDFRVFT